TSYHQTAPPIFRTNFRYFDLVQRSRGTLLAQALSRAPTMLSLEYGANEVLGFATAGQAPPDPFTQQGYAQLMTIALNTIHTVLPATRVAVFNVPDVTSIPFFTTFPAFTVSTTNGSPLPLVGVAGSLQLGDLVLLTAGPLLKNGFGFPTGGFNYVNPAAG